MGARESGTQSDGSSGSLLSKESLPPQIDRYVPLRKLATGGMAELFLAKQSGMEGFEKLVVIKRILSHLAQDDVFVNMFLDEARIAAKLSHANIVQIYDLGKADDSYYIAMEYISGRNVQHLIVKESEESRFIPIEYTCRIIAGVCEGLHYAHTRRDYDRKPLNIIHRDISPQNILVSFAGGVKVVDFGIAKAATQVAQTRAGVLKGKYAYMSPEQVRGAKHIDHRSDIFSVGLVMYEMLTGRRAFERDSSIKTLKAIVQEKPLNPTELNPEIPTAVIKLLSRALEKNPDRRYKNAQEMQLAVEDYLEKSPKKANTVRLSRYMFELFDEDIKTEGGTMVVEGIGEVIIPTRQGSPEKPSDKKKSREPEEHDREDTENSAAQEPSRRASKEEPEENSQDYRPTELEMPKVNMAELKKKYAADKAQEVDEDEDEDEDEEDDKTIPVYDLEDYERIRGEKLGKKSEQGGVIARDYDSPSDFDSNAPTVGIQAIHTVDASSSKTKGQSDVEQTATEPIKQHTINQVKNVTEAPSPEPDLLSEEDDSPTLNFDPAEHNIDINALRGTESIPQSAIPPPPMVANTDAVEDAKAGQGSLAGELEEWGEDTQASPAEVSPEEIVPGLSPAGGAGLSSREAVVGSGGVIKGVRDTGIRPAANPAGRQAKTIKPVEETFSKPAGRAAEQTALKQRELSEAVASAVGSLVNDDAPAPAATSSGMKAAALGVILVLLLGAVAIISYAFLVLPSGGGTAAKIKKEYAQIEIKSDPSGAQVEIDGQNKGVTPLNIFIQTGSSTVILSLDGHEPQTDTIALSGGKPVSKTYKLKPVTKEAK